MRAGVSIIVRTLLATSVALALGASTAIAETGDESEARERVIVMNTGRVMTGFASRNAGGWLVEQSNGRIQVPIEQVRVVAFSMADAYRQQRDSVVEPTPATHVALAQWCISYRLHDEARDELRKCLKLDPDHSTARKLLRRIDDLLAPVDVKPTPTDRTPNRTADGFLTADAESLGGLSNEAAVGFSQRIQPLLMNKCANASCHGTTNPNDKREGFHLLPVRSGTSAQRLYTERNLSQVLRYIDLQQPSLSPLVALPQGSHGGAAGVFNGATGNSQIKMLRAWIKMAADEKRTELAEISDRPSITARLPQASPPQILATSHNATPLELPPPASRGMRGANSNPFADAFKDPNFGVKPAALPGHAPVELTTEQRQGKPVSGGKAPNTVDSPQTGEDRMADEDRPNDDPFDPDVFNRRFHARRSPRK